MSPTRPSAVSMRPGLGFACCWPVPLSALLSARPQLLMPDLNLKLRPRILALEPGTRVVSNSFDMADWEADERVVLTEKGRLRRLLHRAPPDRTGEGRGKAQGGAGRAFPRADLPEGEGQAALGGQGGPGRGQGCRPRGDARRPGPEVAWGDEGRRAGA